MKKKNKITDCCCPVPLSESSCNESDYYAGNTHKGKSFLLDFEKKVCYMNGQKYGDIHSHDKENKTINVVRNFPPWVIDQVITITYKELKEIK